MSWPSKQLVSRVLLWLLALGTIYLIVALIIGLAFSSGEAT